jgi:hypothetical protein
MAALDKWIASQSSPKPNRADAVRLALSEWLTGLGLLNSREDRNNLDKHIHRLEGEISHLKEQATSEPSPAKGMAMLRKAKAKNDLAKAKNKAARRTKT